MIARSFRLSWVFRSVAILIVAGPLYAQSTYAPPPQPGDELGSTPPSAPPSPYYAQPPAINPAPLFPPGPGSGPPPVSPPPPVYQPPLWALPPLPPLVLTPDSTRFWIRSDYVLWWTKNAPLPQPLVTVGSANDPIPGALGQPGTQVIYGGQSVGFDPASGWRLDVGGWIDADQRFGIDAGFFVLASQNAGFAAFSNDNGFPVIARPAINVQNGTEFAYVDSLPGSLAGGVVVNSSSQFFGWELNGLYKLAKTDRFRLDGIFGFRYLNLTESLSVSDQVNPLGPNQLTFLGQPVDPSNTLFDQDLWKTTNNFYGGQLGAKLTWLLGRWSIDATTKVAVGTTQEKAILQGATSVFTPSGAGSIANGGVLNTTSSIGSYYQSLFAVAPEFDLNLNFQITPHLAARLGYTFIFLSNVARPGDQVNRAVNPSLVPSDVTYGQGGPNLPGFAFQTTSYWAQGLNIGLDFTF